MDINEIGGQPAMGVNFNFAEGPDSPATPGWSAGFAGTPIIDAIDTAATRQAELNDVSAARITVYVMAEVTARFALDQITWRAPLGDVEMLRGDTDESLDAAHGIVRDLLDEGIGMLAGGIAYRLHEVSTS